MEPEEVVNQAESTPADQVAQQTEGQQEQVAAVEDGQQEQLPGQGQQPQYEAVDETGIPYKNRYMETQRKLAELSDNLPKIIEETLAKQKQVPQVEEYTVEQLEQLALQNPNLRPQVEAEKMKLYQKETARQIEARDNKIEAQRQFELTRMRTEQEIMNDPALKDCFTTNALGAKQWNMGHPLTGIIGDLMRNPDIANRPDALRIASDIAYGRYMRDVAANSTKQAKNMQALVRREQKKTLVESGTPNGSVSNDGFAKAKAELAKTGSKSAAKNAVLEYMKRAKLGMQG